MCGIFGIHLKNLKKSSQSLVKDIKTLSLLSRKRGQDTFGLLISSMNEEKIFKVNSDPSSVFSTSNYRFIAPVAGYYWIAANVRCNNQGANARVDMLIRRNGAGVMAQGQNQQGSNDMGWSAMGIIQCAVNDYIDIMVNVNGGSNTIITNTSNTGNEGGSQTISWFQGYLIQAT